jgi:hypothetical protein
MTIVLCVHIWMRPTGIRVYVLFNNYSTEHACNFCISICNSSSINTTAMRTARGDMSLRTCISLKNAVFWDVAPCRYFNRRFGGTYRLHLQGIRNPRAMNQRDLVVVAGCLWLALSLQIPAHAGSSLVISFTPKIEAIRSSETSINKISTWRHIPEDGILHSHRRENLISYIVYFFIFYDLMMMSVAQSICRRIRS